MEVTMQIPDDIAARISQSGPDLSRRALESLALEELKSGRITEPELGRMLGLARLQIDGFLKAHGVYQDYTLEDFEQERQALKELGF
jgi:predicted HTH domain antitoxin